MSLPKGKQFLDHDEQASFLGDYLEEKLGFGVIPRWRDKPSGPDIIAAKDRALWRIECKGLGTGQPSTLRNNFDRALSSAVSYYDGAEGNRLGVALPRPDVYLTRVRKKIPEPLRKALCLWVLLYNPQTDSIDAMAPSTG